MNNAEAIIEKFYTAFASRDSHTMNSCYAEDISFYDPVFELLRGDEVLSMWEMLCANAQDLQITHANFKDLGDGYYTCDWTATYTFSLTGKRVVNNVRANMKILNDLIIEHSDGFSLHKWSAQAFGIIGKLLGWNGVFQRRIKNTAKKNLLRYIDQQ